MAQGDPGFDCSVISLGMVGIVTQVSLRLVPKFSVRQRVYTHGWPSVYEQHGSLDSMIQGLPAAMRSTDSFSWFVDWAHDDPGMLILRDFVPQGQGASESPPPEGTWAGAPLQMEPIRGKACCHPMPVAVHPMPVTVPCMPACNTLHALGVLHTPGKVSI